MNRAELLEKLRELKPWLAEQGIGNPRLYGSFARDEAGPDSDVDLVIELTKPLGLDYFSVERELGRRLGGRTVEFVTARAMHRLIRDRVLSEAIVV
jgi:predicted nucleotidyltransferase